MTETLPLHHRLVNTIDRPLFGMRELATFLRARGAIIPPELTIVSGSGLSRDGRRICGYAYDLDYNLIAWVAELP